MSEIFIRLLLVIFLSVISWRPSLAETYTCSEDVIEEEAKLAVHRGNAVTITEDEDDKECYFSVNGAKVGSPTQERIFSGFNSIITGSVAQELRRGNISSLAYALLASAPVTDIPRNMRNILRRHSRELSECLAVFLRGGMPREFRADSVQCRVWRPGDRGPLTVTIPTLEIAVRWDRTRSRLFLPQGYRQGRPISF
jgi:hypothetical protein